MAYIIKPKADAEFNAFSEQVLRQRMLGLITSSQARKMLTDRFQRDVYEALQEADPDRNIGLRCPDCERVNVMSARVKVYQCACSPHIDRKTSEHQVPLV